MQQLDRKKQGYNLKAFVMY